MVKRNTIVDYSEEYERFAEWFGEKATYKDRSEFNIAYAKEMGVFSSNGKAGAFRDGVWEKYAQQVGVDPDSKVFNEAKGKDLERDRRKTARIVVKDRGEFNRLGARRVDLEGFDTRRITVTQRAREPRILDIPSRVKGKVVFSEKTSVVVKGKTLVRYRDSKGRFASAKN